MFHITIHVNTSLHQLAVGQKNTYTESKWMKPAVTPLLTMPFNKTPYDVWTKSLSLPTQQLVFLADFSPPGEGEKEGVGQSPDW